LHGVYPVFLPAQGRPLWIRGTTLGRGTVDTDIDGDLFEHDFPGLGLQKIKKGGRDNACKSQR
jgi:hypothetical protein